MFVLTIYIQHHSRPSKEQVYKASEWIKETSGPMLSDEKEITKFSHEVKVSIIYYVRHSDASNLSKGTVKNFK